MREQKLVPTCTEGIPDATLVLQALAGDQRAFAVLVERYSATLLKHISRYVKDPDQAYDVLQQVLLQFYRCLPILEAGRPLKPWLLRVAQNRCLDECRKRQRRRETCFSELDGRDIEEEMFPIAVLADPLPLPEDYAEYHDLLRSVEQALWGLTPASRSVVLLRCVEGLPFAKIGQHLCMPESTVKTRFHRARTRLREVLALNSRAIL